MESAEGEESKCLEATSHRTPTVGIQMARTSKSPAPIFGRTTPAESASSFLRTQNAGNTLKRVPKANSRISDNSRSKPQVVHPKLGHRYDEGTEENEDVYTRIAQRIRLK